MNETVTNQESNKPVFGAKLLGLPRSIAGALIGVLFFTTLVVLSERADLVILNLILLVPGFLVNVALQPWTETLSISKYFLWPVIAYITPAIPSAILGSLFVSRKKGVRIIGIIMLITYFVFSAFTAYRIMD